MACFSPDECGQDWHCSYNVEAAHTVSACDSLKNKCRCCWNCSWSIDDYSSNSQWCQHRINSYVYYFLPYLASQFGWKYTLSDTTYWPHSTFTFFKYIRDQVVGNTWPKTSALQNHKFLCSSRTGMTGTGLYVSLYFLRVLGFLERLGSLSSSGYPWDIAFSSASGAHHLFASIMFSSFCLKLFLKMCCSQ